MIDAYEIGIQLMLQEDVSAGLDVINRGLADVDRAIAATSADLAGLVRNADTATKAVSSAMGSRTALVPLPDQQPIASLDESGQGGPPRALLSTSSPPSDVVASSSANAVAPKPVAPAKIGDDQHGGDHGPSTPGLDERSASSFAPVRSAVNETVPNSESLDGRRNEPGKATEPLNATQVAPAAPTLSAVAASPAQDVANTLWHPPRGVTPSVTPVALTASVNRELRSPSAARHSERVQHSSIAGAPPRRERPVAPWSGIDQSGTQVASARIHEAAAAPQSAGRGQAEATGGTVMLDGRLVGQWLSEHMGREASRPPAGTSFFDPRQTPAWNVSGAL